MSRSTDSRRTRTCEIAKAPNCSIVQIQENVPVLYGKRLYTWAMATDVDYRNNRAMFYTEPEGGPYSLNQDPGQRDSDKEYIRVPLNIAFEIWKAFEEIDQENIRRVNSL